MPASDALAGRRVLVIGATGFLGSHLTRALVDAGADVHALMRVRGRLDRRAHEHLGDLTDSGTVREALADARPEVVFHLAAYGTTPAQRDAARMRAVNVGGVQHLWACLAHTTARLVQTGTCAEYAPKDGALCEHDPCRPSSDYAQTMHEAVLYSLEQGRRAGREVVILRPFGPYGAGDRPERLIPHVIEGLLGGGRVAVTAGEQRRDYSHVDDHVRALAAAAIVPLAGTPRVYNIGSGRPIRVRHLVEAVADAVGEGSRDRIDYGAVPSRVEDGTDRFADIAAARRDLGYEPTVGLADGLARTVQAARTAREAVPR